MFCQIIRTYWRHNPRDFISLHWISDSVETWSWTAFISNKSHILSSHNQLSIELTILVFPFLVRCVHVFHSYTRIPKVDTYLTNCKKDAIVDILLFVYTATVVIFIDPRVVFQKQMLKSYSILLFKRNHQLVTQTKKDEL